jgi:hypothetical protein
MKKKLPPEVLEYFRKQGAKGGKIGGRIGGKRSLETMTPKERVARAKKRLRPQRLRCEERRPGRKRSVPRDRF